MRSGVLIAAAAALLLGGCSATPPRDAAGGVSGAASGADATMDPIQARAVAHQARLAGLDAWAVKGRIGLIRGDEGWHAGLDWRQTRDAYQIELDGPIGRAALRLIGGPAGITLLLPDEAPVSATDPDALIRETLGFEMPVSGLRWWATGRVSPEASSVTTLDPEGRLAEIRQQGWLVRISAYQAVAGLDLPRKLRLEHPEVTIKLVLREWALDGPPDGRSAP